jgi:hypothetical protein
MRNLLPLVFFLPLLLASGGGCGRQVSDSISDGGNHGDDTNPGDGGSPDGGCVYGDVPGVACEAPCGGGQVDPQCIDGIWQCPEYAGGIDCPPPPEDAGVDACSYTVGACPGDPPCIGFYPTPVCENGNWSCQWSGVCEDGGVPDATTTLFACGDLACDPTLSYCQITTGGPVNEDGGTSSGYWCEPLPTSCAQGQATCDCVQAFGGVSNACSCIGQNGDVIVTCDYP